MKKYIILTIVACTAIFASAHAQGYVFSNDLLVGSSGPDVTNLQTWLLSNGFDIPAISSGISGKGYFGSQTKLALIRYQQSLGFPAFGYFGPMTRGYINGHNNPNNASFKVTSPNSGETWVKGTTQNITWSGSANVLAQKGDIKLEYPLPACAQPGQIIRCMIMVRAPLTIAKNVDLNSRSYSWYVGQVQELHTGTDANMASDGQYKIQICPADGSTCDESDSTFTISSNPVTGNAPVINGVDTPTTLSVGQTGTWTVRATDPLNGTLSYSAIWGDGSILPPGMVGNAAQPTISQTSTFTHVYTTAGTYTATFTVTNSSGQSARITSTVVVTGSTSAGPLKIISPNGGEVWLRGTTQNITWTSPYYFRATTADLKIVQKFVCTTQVCPAIAYAPYTIATGIPINNNTYSWNVGSARASWCLTGIDSASCPLDSGAIQDGQYSVQICETGTNNCDWSDAVFTISSSQTSNLPDINIISPNGGEVLPIGSSQQVIANVTGDPAQAGDIMSAYLVNSSNQMSYLKASQTYGVKTGTRTLWVEIPSTTLPGSYKIYVTLSNSGSTSIQAYDYSNNYFTLIKQNPVYYDLSQCPAGYTCTPVSSY